MNVKEIKDFLAEQGFCNDPYNDPLNLPLFYRNEWLLLRVQIGLDDTLAVAVCLKPLFEGWDCSGVLRIFDSLDDFRVWIEHCGYLEDASKEIFYAVSENDLTESKENKTLWSKRLYLLATQAKEIVRLFGE